MRERDSGSRSNCNASGSVATTKCLKCKLSANKPRFCFFFFPFLRAQVGSRLKGQVSKNPFPLLAPNPEKKWLVPREAAATHFFNDPQ